MEAPKSLSFASFVGKTITFSGKGLFSGKPFENSQVIQRCSDAPSGLCHGESWIAEDGRITYYLDDGNHWVAVVDNGGKIGATHGFTDKDGNVQVTKKINVTIQ